MNKEVSVFAFSAAVFAIAVWHWLASAPVPLNDPRTLSNAPPPGAAHSRSGWTADGLERRAGTRRNPFAPVTPSAPPVAESDLPGVAGGAPPPKPGDRRAGGEAKREPLRFVPPLEFAGVVITPARRAALLRTRDGARTWLLEEKGGIAEFGCTVTHIASQAVSIQDGFGEVYVLRDRSIDSAVYPSLAQAE